MRTSYNGVLLVQSTNRTTTNRTTTNRTTTNRTTTIRTTTISIPYYIMIDIKILCIVSNCLRL